MTLEKFLKTYLDMESFGANLIIKKYADFPRFLPLPCHIEHGVTVRSGPLLSDLGPAKGKGMMLVYSKRRAKAWQKQTDIATVISGAPFVLYRQMGKIARKPNAKGTIVFPAHSTIFLDNRYDPEKYCQAIKGLPKSLRPITVCLLYTEIKQGYDKVYKKHGFKVVSAGPKLRGSLEFVENFYRLLSAHRYATSNQVGSYSYYAIEMGIPFFLAGEEPITYNLGKDPNHTAVDKTSRYALGKKAIKLFKYSSRPRITNAQREFVLSEVGVGKAMSPAELRKRLFNQTKNLRYWLVLAPMYWLLSVVRLFVPQSFAYWLLKRF